MSAWRTCGLAIEMESTGQSTDLTRAQAILERLVPELGNAIRGLESCCLVDTQ